MTRSWFISRLAIAVGVGALVVVAALLWIPDPMAARAAAIAGLCVTLWLTEAVPPFAPPLLLLLKGTTATESRSTAYWQLHSVRGWSRAMSRATLPY